MIRFLGENIIGSRIRTYDPRYPRSRITKEPQWLNRDFGTILPTVSDLNRMGARGVIATHHWKCQLAKNKELLIPPIWDCCGPTEGSFFTHGQIKNPAFFEGRCFTGKMIRQMWAESAVCLNSYL